MWPSGSPPQEFILLFQKCFWSKFFGLFYYLQRQQQQQQKFQVVTWTSQSVQQMSNHHWPQISSKLKRKSPRKMKWLRVSLQWNNSPCLVPILAHRWQLWKGKQNKIYEEKSWRKQQTCQVFKILKLQKYLVIVKRTSFTHWPHLVFWNWGCIHNISFSS